ncbi:hypothetical protein DPEC_G00294330 [Dallia pectoralis]|uniref:Uncharacterized protein n=1 Tax=Dallia pectoralis TaxID=75939 RepID=A0ACC2FIJ5_DALPE|nr:hypothetical protein DPEC_G00294330 [Dallia pectoralis]
MLLHDVMKLSSAKNRMSYALGLPEVEEALTYSEPEPAPASSVFGPPRLEDVEEDWPLPPKPDRSPQSQSGSHFTAH